MKRFLAVILCAAVLLCPLGAAFAEADDELKASSAEEIMEVFGVRFGVPEGAEDVSYQIYETFAQMRLTLNGVEYAARIQPTDSFANISPRECDPWDIIDDCLIGWCEGRVQMRSFEDDIFSLCLWYDAAPGLMYAVYSETADFIGVDVQGVAEAVFTPMQDDVDGLTGEMLYEALSACTGYAGTAGSSLKNAVAACRLAAFAAEHQLADMEEAALSEIAADAILLLTDDQKTELIFNLESIRGVLTEAFADYESVSGLFEDAGVHEEIKLLMAASRTQEHFTALYEALAAAWLAE